MAQWAHESRTKLQMSCWLVWLFKFFQCGYVRRELARKGEGKKGTGDCGGGDRRDWSKLPSSTGVRECSEFMLQKALWCYHQCPLDPACTAFFTCCASFQQCLSKRPHCRGEGGISYGFCYPRGGLPNRVLGLKSAGSEGSPNWAPFYPIPPSAAVVVKDANRTVYDWQFFWEERNCGSLIATQLAVLWVCCIAAVSCGFNKPISLRVWRTPVQT